MNFPLRPCPFCGTPAALTYDSGNEVVNQTWTIACKKSCVKMSKQGSNSWASDKKEDAGVRRSLVTKWNTRVS